jgi:hypothetical protein
VSLVDGESRFMVTPSVPLSFRHFDDLQPATWSRLKRLTQRLWHEAKLDQHNFFRNFFL